MDTLEFVPAKSIVTKTKSSAWFGANYNMNIYRGCSHGCIYCDSRSACYGIKQFDTVRVKENALEVIRNDLRRKVRTGVISTGSMSDPYNPLEAIYHYTENALRLIHAYGFGVAVATKSSLVTRDIGLFQDIKEAAPVLVKMTITTADNALSKKIEPHAASSSERFAALHTLYEQGLFCGILLMPVLPFLEDTDENILAIVHRAAECGARFIYPAFGMTMRDTQREYFLSNMEQLFPGIREKYINAFGTNYQCTSPRARALWAVFKKECDRAGILYKMGDIISAYKLGYGDSQLSFFKD